MAESYGGRDEPVDSLVGSLVDVGVEVVLDPLRVKEMPTQALYQTFEEAGTDLAQALVQKEVRQWLACWKLPACLLGFTHQGCCCLVSRMCHTYAMHAATWLSADNCLLARLQDKASCNTAMHPCCTQLPTHLPHLLPHPPPHLLHR